MSDKQKFFERIKIDTNLMQKQKKIENDKLKMENLSNGEKQKLIELYKLQIYSKKNELYELKEKIIQYLKNNN